MIATAARRRHLDAQASGVTNHPDRPDSPPSPLPLGLLAPGERAEIVGADDRPHGASRTEDLGLRPGRLVEMLAGGGHGPLLVKLEESRLALGRGMAMKILVRRLP